VLGRLVGDPELGALEGKPRDTAPSGDSTRNTSTAPKADL
jgi:hypothetical protein